MGTKKQVLVKVIENDVFLAIRNQEKNSSEEKSTGGEHSLAIKEEKVLKDGGKSSGTPLTKSGKFTKQCQERPPRDIIMKLSKIKR